MIKCDKCDSTNIDFVEIKSVEYRNGLEYEGYEDVPYCVSCFERDAKMESEMIRHEIDIDNVIEGAVDER
jgi:hypothetical protein